MAKRVIETDLADVWASRQRKDFVRTLAWGDEIEVVEETAEFLRVQTVEFVKHPDGSILPETRDGFIEPSKASKLKVPSLTRPAAQNEVLRVNFVDVQQGDGAVIESPDGKVILVDGGDNQMFARYLAARFRDTSLQAPRKIDCIVVTHGDADHFVGLAEIFDSEKNANPRKRLFMQPARIFHNGIVKGPSRRNGKRVPDKELLGPTKKIDGVTWVTGLTDDLLAVDDALMNEPFRKWRDALKTYNQRSALAFKRLEFGDSSPFDFFKTPDMKIEVLGPIVGKIDGNPALPFLGEPPAGPRIGHESMDIGPLDSKGLSASHTINGHSIVFKLSYRGFSYLFCGDLNDEASRFLARNHNDGTINLRSEVFKVPHHGSADFSGGFIQAVSPVVSVVSSGDESLLKEYIHPRATLMGALGRLSRVEEPLIFVTELVAFFKLEGWAKLTDAQKSEKRGEFFAFSRTAYGMVKTRTDGRRLLAWTDSGNVDLKEAYAYQLDDHGVPQPSAVVRA
jgi:beta-lactamase superfamily II metal-dependent hydrolase